MQRRKKKREEIEQKKSNGNKNKDEDEIDGLNRTLELQRLLYFEQEKRRVRIRALMKSVRGNSKNAYQYGGLKLEFQFDYT